MTPLCIVQVAQWPLCVRRCRIAYSRGVSAAVFFAFPPSPLFSFVSEAKRVCRETATRMTMSARCALRRGVWSINITIPQDWPDMHLKLSLDELNGAF